MTYTPPSAAGGAITPTLIEVDLGATPVWEGKFTITDGDIDTSSMVFCWQAPGPYTGKGTLADEARLTPVHVLAVESRLGEAIVYWQTLPIVVDSLKYTISSPLGGGTAANSGTNRDRQVVARRTNRVRGSVKFLYVVW